MVISCITKVILVGFDENHPYIETHFNTLLAK